MKQQEAIDINPFGADIVTEPRTIEPSVKSLNDDALKLVLQRFARLKADTTKGEDATPGILLIQSPEPGYGKSHLIGRLFQELDDDATLLYVRAFQDPASPWINLLETVVQELDYPDRAGAITREPGEPSQLDVLTRRVLLKLTRVLLERGKLKGVKGGADLAKFPNAMFEMPEWRSWLTHERDNLLNLADSLLGEQGIALHPNRQAWLKVLIAYAFSEDDASVRQTCLDWLRYQPMESEEGKQIGLKLADLPEVAPTNDQRNERCFRRIQDLFHLGRYYRPFLLCFDQTELYGRDSKLARVFGITLSRLRREAKNHLTIVTANQFVWEQRVRNHFDAADQQSLEARPINLEGVDESQAKDLLLARLRSWKQEAKKERVDGKWLGALFKGMPRRSARDILREASKHWDADLPQPSIDAVFESYRARLLADPKRLDFHAGVLQRVAQLVLGPAAGAQVDALESSNRYLRVRWRLENKRQVLLGFEAGSHWKTWEAIVNEAESHHSAARAPTSVVMFRTAEQRKLAERNHKQLAKSSFIRLMELPREHAAILYAADELYADALQGDQPYSEAEVLKFCRSRVLALVSELIAGGGKASVRPRTPRPPPPGPPKAALTEIVREHVFISMTVAIDKLAKRGIHTTQDEVLISVKDISQIAVFASPKTVLLKWIQSA